MKIAQQTETCFPRNLTFSIPVSTGNSKNVLQDMKIIILLWVGNYAWNDIVFLKNSLCDST